MFDSSNDINKQTILELVTQEDIFERYLGIKVDLDYAVRNPLRDDINPTCAFKWIGDKLYFRDWTEPKSKDCFDIVKQIYQCNFQQAIDIVAKDFGLLDGNINPVKVVRNPTPRQPANIQLKRQKFTKTCIAYWLSQGIHEETLIKFNVTSVQSIWIRGNKVYDWSSRDIAFAYQFTDTLIKIYFPFRKKGQIRFFNTDNTVLEGYSLLPPTGDLLLITKSYKDTMALYEYGITSVAPASEAITMNPLIVNILYTRFPTIYSLMDNDWPGRRAAIRLKQEHGIPPLIFPVGEPKDFTDNYKKYGNLYMLDTIEHTKQFYGL